MHEDAVNRDIFGGQWKQLKGKIKSQWAKLTDNDLLEVEGKRDQLVGRIQERYGLAKEEVEEELRAFERKHYPPRASGEVN